MAIELSIIEPQNNQFFSGSSNVSFVGAAEISDDLTSVPLFYRWYSSLYVSEQEENQYSMNMNANRAADTNFNYQLGVGSHVITFSASNVEGESKSDFSSIEHGGVTGGSDGDSQCIIHVLIANQLLPLDSSSISRELVQLEAEAPSQWGVSENVETGTEPYVVNKDYHAINRIRYRWLFDPVGEPGTRPVLEFIPTIDEMTFVPMDSQDVTTEPTRIRVSTTLPSDALGEYNLTLFVEDSEEESVELDSDQILVTFI